MAKQAKNPASIKLKNSLRDRAKVLGAQVTRAESVILRAAIVYGLNAFETADGKQLMEAAIAEEDKLPKETPPKTAPPMTTGTFKAAMGPEDTPPATRKALIAYAEQEAPLVPPKGRKKR